MPISHIFAEGIGPFKKVHLDLRGPNRKASYGPHILAGVNGSGKSTLLKALAWCTAEEGDGFQMEEWKQFLAGHLESRVLVVYEGDGQKWAQAAGRGLDGWVARTLHAVGLSLSEFGGGSVYLGNANLIRHWYGADVKDTRHRHNIAAYVPNRALSYLDQVKHSSPSKATGNRFSFEKTINNEDVQSWLVGLFSRRAIAEQRHQETERYTATFSALEEGLRRVCGDQVSILVDIEPQLLPKLKIGDQTLNFSQVPDGIKSTLGWIADFMMRAENLDWYPGISDRREGVLLFDEIETYLHPLWQRRILPAMKIALPKTQFLVTSHSPFVISSCRDAMVHVLKIGSDGFAYAEPPVKAPIGESITSTLKDIFGVDSRFDVETEDELKEWNELQKSRSGHKLSAKQESRLRELTETLGARSEELRSIVNLVPKLAKSMVDSLTGVAPVRANRPKRVASR